ncbi:EamA family transporter [Actinoplanes sp. URMC 104]|uniref:EamA family transporter n=1 Tax=Actinoplanes sp. URMC 104 TaxID=3423409 RepID=UPI003F19C77C
MMTAAALAALAWGVSDFLAGLLARRLPLLTILAGSKVAAMALVIAAAAVRGVPPPTDGRLLLAVAAGLVGLPAMGLLYRAMRDGSLAVVAPVAAVAALVPVGWGMLHGERLGLLAALGVVAGLAGATMAGWPVSSADRARRSATVCALVAALGFGAYFVLLHEASAADQFWATALARISGGCGALALVAALGWRRLAIGPALSCGRPAAGPPSPLFKIAVCHRLPRPPGCGREPRPATRAARVIHIPQLSTPAVHGGPPTSPARAARGRLLAPGMGAAITILAVGATDALADASFTVAAAGALAAAAVLASLYPAVTLVLNRSLLRERLHTVHLYGVLTALLAVACLAT